MAVVALAVGGLAYLQNPALRSDVDALRDQIESADLAFQRVGVEPIDPALATDVPNVARDPSDVPAPIDRSQPATVSFTLTTEEVTAELADGTTFSFWTFNGTVPGPMLRVMEGDTVEITLVNPSDSLVPHNIDLR